MWMMLPCLLILVFAIFAGGGGLQSWPFLVIVGVMVAGHLWMMFRGRRRGSSDEEHRDMTDIKQISQENTSSTDEKKGHTDHSCCH